MRKVLAATALAALLGACSASAPRAPARPFDRAEAPDRECENWVAPGGRIVPGFCEDGPTTTRDLLILAPGASGESAVLANDKAGEGRRLVPRTLRIVSNSNIPAGKPTVDTERGVIAYEAGTAQEHYLASIKYVVCDSEGLCAEGILTVSDRRGRDRTPSPS